MLPRPGASGLIRVKTGAPRAPRVMTMTKPFRHILVATDGSRLSQRAVKTAIALARMAKARITALHVVAEYMPPVYLDALIAMPETESALYKRSTEAYAEELLAKIAKEARAAGVACHKVHVVHETPWRAIIRTAKSRRCDLIVMASHGRRGMEALLLGSETTKVLAHSKTPVLVCR